MELTSLILLHADYICSRFLFQGLIFQLKNIESSQAQGIFFHGW